MRFAVAAIEEEATSINFVSDEMLFSGNLGRRLLLLLHRKTPTAHHQLRRLTSHATVPKDDYFAAIHHISSIVRRDHFMERTLNKLPLSPSPDLVLRVLRSCSDAATQSLRFFNWVRATHPSYSPTSLEFQELIKIFARASKYDSIWKIATQIKTHNLSVSPETLCYVIEQYGKSGAVDRALEVFNRARAFNCKQTIEVYNSLLFALCEAKMYDGAHALIRRMTRKGVVPNKRSYSILVSGWCCAGKVVEAEEFLEDMTRKGFNPPVPAQDLLIEGLLNSGYLDHAMEMVKKLTTQGLVLSVETFNTSLEAFCKSGKTVFCISLYNKVCELGFSPDIDTYKVLIRAVSKEGMMDEATKLLHCSIEDGHKPFPSLYAPIIKGLCRRGQFDDAYSFFSDMKVKGHPPNRPIYVMLITLSGRGGKFVEAANYLVEMTEFGLAPISQCFDMVCDGLKKCGKHDLAKKIEQMQRGD